MKKITLFMSALLISAMSFAQGAFITCAEAVAICEQTGSTLTADSYTVRGYVTEIKYAWSEQYGTATFWIADTQDGGKVLQAYSCKPLTEADKVFAVGDYVELVGKMKQYNTTSEVERGTYTHVGSTEGGETPDTPVEPETPELPYGPETTLTCAQALEVCLATGTTSTTDSYTIRGYVTSIKYEWSEQYGNISFNMADTKDGEGILLAYRVKPVNEAEKNVKAGDFVEVVGTLVNYMNNTPEVNAGGKYTIITAAEGGDTPVEPEEPETPVEPETPAGEPLTDGYAKVTDMATLANGDKVVLYCDEYAVGVAGFDGNKSATMAATDWVEYVVETVEGGLKLKDAVAGQYIALTEKNSFRYNAEGSVLNVTENAMLSAYLESEGKTYFLYRNANSKNANPLCRMYVDKSGDKEYAPFYVYEVVEAGETTGVEDITVNEKVAKVIKNGQIYIIKGGKTYNALGAEVK